MPHAMGRQQLRLMASAHPIPAMEAAIHTGGKPGDNNTPRTPTRNAIENAIC
jgi:hypothetical protein